jgi:hypothetical protein
MQPTIAFALAASSIAFAAGTLAHRTLVPVAFAQCAAIDALAALPFGAPHATSADTERVRIVCTWQPAVAAFQP